MLFEKIKRKYIIEVLLGNLRRLKIRIHPQNFKNAVNYERRILIVLRLFNSFLDAR